MICKRLQAACMRLSIATVCFRPALSWAAGPCQAKVTANVLPQLSSHSLQLFLPGGQSRPEAECGPCRGRRSLRSRGRELTPQAPRLRLQEAGAHLTSSHPASLWTLLPD